MTPVIILGGIFSGIFTPSEAAVVAVNYALLVSIFVYRDLTLPQVYKLLIRSAMTTAVIMLVIAMSAVLSWTLSSWQVPGAIAQAVLSLSTNPYVIMLLVVAVILLTGVFIETASALIILTPVLLPLVLQLGIDPIHFADHRSGAIDWHDYPTRGDQPLRGIVRHPAAPGADHPRHHPLSAS